MKEEMILDWMISTTCGDTLHYHPQMCSNNLLKIALLNNFQIICLDDEFYNPHILTENYWRGRGISSGDGCDEDCCNEESQEGMGAACGQGEGKYFGTWSAGFSTGSGDGDGWGNELEYYT